MTVSEAALRHGVLYDLLGRVMHHDMREATVAQFMRRYHVDAAQAARVRDLALRIYDQLAPASSGEDDPDRMLLDWAARLAEVGLSIAHAQYHKHSAYVLSNADMPGFSRVEQQRLARIVLAHRGKLEKMRTDGHRGRRLEPGVCAPARLDAAAPAHARPAAGVSRDRAVMRATRSSCRNPGSRATPSRPPRSSRRRRQWEAVGRQFAVRRMS